MLQTAAAKVQNHLRCTKDLTKKCTLQFELLTTYQSKIPCKMSYTPNMPVMNGFELAQLIREQDRDVLIFFLTDRTEKADRLKGFDLKGNDYIPKPFYPEELIAKIKERFEHHKSAPSTRMAIGQTIFDRNLSTIEIDEVVQHLSARQSEILTILAQNIGLTVERDIILQSVWGNDSYANSLALNVQITYLRKMLEADTSISIVSLKKRGYRLEVI